VGLTTLAPGAVASGVHVAAAGTPVHHCKH
jgi:hypothetical protein